MTNAKLNPTTYALLGLLSLQPWTTYELTKQVQHSLDKFLPRASSRLYAEAKRLAERGLATATKELVGKRPRTVYEITQDGRDALREWLDSPGAPLSMDFEALTKVFFAEQGGIDGLRANLESMHEWARERSAVEAEGSARFVAGGAEFPDRLAVLALVGGFVFELNKLVEEWTAWALDVTDDWPADPASWPVEMSVFERAAEQDHVFDRVE